MYPAKLAHAVVDRLREAEFILGALPKPAKRGDVSFVAGCLFRVVGLCAHAVHAKAGRWVISEKGLVDAAGRLPQAGRVRPASTPDSGKSGHRAGRPADCDHLGRNTPR